MFQLSTVQFVLAERVRELATVTEDTEDHINRQDKLHDEVRKEKVYAFILIKNMNIYIYCV